MALLVTIAGVDKSSFVDWDSLNVDQQITSQVDTATFRIKKYGTKNYAPALGDSVTITDGATAIFGGTIVRIDDTIDAGTLTYLSITAVSHERTLDRYLVSREITNRSARYVINTILDEFVNRMSKTVDTMESTETWVQEDGTLAADTTNGNFLAGEQSQKLTATASNTATTRRETTLDLTLFDDGSASTTSDIITFWYKVDSAANFASLRVRFVSDSGATYTNYFETTISATPVVGWNQARIAKSAFTSTGSPSWASVLKRQYRATASASGTVNVQIDDTRMVQASTYFSQANVEDADTPFLGSVKFNYEQVSQAIKQIAEAVGNDWYIDPSRDLHFYQPASVAAPFSLTDTSANFVWNSLVIKKDNATIKNQIYVRGGEYQGASANFDVEADGVALNWRSPYRIKNISVTVAAVSKTVGVDYLDDPASFDCLYNYQEKTLKFKAATLPTAGQTIRMTGNPMTPVIIKKGDPTSIAANGIYEFVILDKSIITLQGGRDRATAELRNYRNSLTEGNFTTDTAGLRAGQTININITARGIADDYIIKSVNFRTKSPTEFFYDVRLVSTRTFGIIEYLLGLLRNDRKQIQINDNEVIDFVQELNETIVATDTWTQASQNEQTETITPSDSVDTGVDQGTIFVYGPYVHTGFADTKRVFIASGSLLG